MIQTVQFLEPRIEVAGITIFDELDEVNEIIFIMHGTVDMGFELNKMRKIGLRFRKSNAFGAYECIKDQRSSYITVCRT